jgi:hypothetical protein
MKSAPIPAGLRPTETCERLRKISEYLKTKEDLTREEYGWFSPEAEQVRRKIDAVMDARAVIIREFDL